MPFLHYFGGAAAEPEPGQAVRLGLEKTFRPRGWARKQDDRRLRRCRELYSVTAPPAPQAGESAQAERRAAVRQLTAKTAAPPPPAPRPRLPPLRPPGPTVPRWSSRRGGAYGRPTHSGVSNFRPMTTRLHIPDNDRGCREGHNHIARTARPRNGGRLRADRGGGETRKSVARLLSPQTGTSESPTGGMSHPVLDVDARRFQRNRPIRGDPFIWPIVNAVT